MVQTNLSMFIKEEEASYNEKTRYIHHPYIKDNTIIERRYQVEIARHALTHNTAVILPTGLGKTIIAILVIAHILPRRVLFLAPTKPLVSQHYETCRRMLRIDETDVQMITGGVSARRRTMLFNKATIIVATPQTIKNDLEKKRYKLDDLGLIIFDEMHRAVENYAYVYIAKHSKCRILGLTASPGSKKKKINKILENLKITSVESRTRDDPDVKDHVKDMVIDWVKIPMDKNIKTVRKPLYDLYLEKLKQLNKLGILTYKKPEYISKKDILNARSTIYKRFKNKPFIYNVYNNHTILMHAYHCLELVETQGIDSFLRYIEKYNDKKDKTRSERILLKHPLIIEAVKKAKRKKVLSHPKLEALTRIITQQFKDEPDSLVIIFTQYRDTIKSIEESLNHIPGVKYHRFIGQAGERDSKGMSQKEQQNIIERFRDREINVLIATSIGEEGIDIPNVNRVVFYEPIPSEIRAIQRKGRTGRTHIGKVTILITEETKDESYLYAEKQREQKMHRLLRRMR
jgi:ERCC4-related helicase